MLWLIQKVDSEGVTQYGEGGKGGVGGGVGGGGGVSKYEIVNTMGI